MRLTYYQYQGNKYLKNEHLFLFLTNFVGAILLLHF